MVRMTTARQLILDELEGAKSHLTAMQIFDILKERLPSLSLSTVYRSLEYLVKNHLVSVSDLGLGSPVYESIQPHIHHHLVCLNCNQIYQLEDEIVSQFFEKLQKEKNFTIHSNHLILYGKCQYCQEIDTPDERSLN
jgi:Fur family ferric uptake transcriptional regulator